ncbi:MAG: hypothetical protein RIQ81_2129 [Pseudomonadota bacterium]
MKRINGKFLSAVLFLVASSAIARGSQGDAKSNSQTYEIPGIPVSLAWSAEQGGKPARIGPDKILKLKVRLIGKDGQPAPSSFKLESFDARMPEHNHGMVTKPVVKSDSAGQFSVDGVKLHMPGKWVLDFVVSGKSVKVPLEVKIQD